MDFGITPMTLPACLEGGGGGLAHEPDAAPAVDEGGVGLGESAADAAGGVDVVRGEVVAGRAEDGEG
jgi:hypothetical protein